MKGKLLMKKKIKRFISLVLTAVMAMSLAVIPTAAAEADRITVDFSSRDAFEKNAFVYRHTPSDTEPDAYTGGKYSFSEANSAMRIEYKVTPNKANYRLMFGFDTPGALKYEYKYMVIVYAADTSKSYKMTLWNSPKHGNEVVIAANGASTGGKFVATAPFDVSATSTANSILSRWNGGSHNTLSIASDDTEARFLIKEISFFKSESDARSYTSSLSLPSLRDEITPTSSGEKTPKSVEKIVVSLRSSEDLEKKGMLYSHTPTEKEPDPNLAGVISFDSKQQAMKLDYSPTDKYGPYRVMLHLNRAKLTAEYKYFVMVYKANTSSTYSMDIWNGGHWGENYSVAKNQQGQGDKWIITEPYDISVESDTDKSLLTRWAKGSFNYINIACADRNAQFFIKELAFFRSAEDAKLYYAGVDLSLHPETYQYTEEELKYGELPEVLPEPVILDLDRDRSAIAKDGILLKAGVSVSKLGDTSAARISYSPSKNYKNYSALIAFDKYGMLTPHHRVVRVTYMSDTTAVVNLSMADANSVNDITLTASVAQSEGKFVRTNAISIAASDIISELNNGYFMRLQSNSESADTNIYISEIAFFCTKEQAYAYYGDEYKPEAVVENAAMIFGENSNAAYLNGETYGVHKENMEDNTLDITYAEESNISGTSYQAKIKFASTDRSYTANKVYVRVLYKATNPEGATGVVLRLRNDKSGSDYVDLVKDVKTTDGYVLSPVGKISEDTAQRFAGSGAYKGKMHNSLFFMTTLPGGEYKIKAIYFFNTEEDAEAFDPHLEGFDLKVNGNHFKSYQVVIPENAAMREELAAEMLVRRIKQLTGVELPIVTSAVGETNGCEFLIGDTGREASDKFYGENGYYLTGSHAIGEYTMAIDGKKVVFAANNPYSVLELVTNWCNAYLVSARADRDGVVSIPSNAVISGSTSNVVRTTGWKQTPGSADSELYLDFTEDEGYLTEDHGNNSYVYDNGKLVGIGGFAYVQTFERNVIISANISKKAAQREDHIIALVLRSNSDEAYLRGGYDFEKGVYFIEEREGDDLRAVRLAEKKADFSDGAELKFEAIAKTAALFVDGKRVCETVAVNHITPGRPGIYSFGCTVECDDLYILVRDAEGSFMRNVEHTVIDDGYYLEGGTVIELTDGRLVYFRDPEDTYVSRDNGTTWQKSEPFTEYTGYPNILRLANGDLLMVVLGTVNGSSMRRAILSSDDGKTWRDGGAICYQSLNNTENMAAGNMNDKLTQMSDGRIFYVQNYQARNANELYKGYINVFCEVWYSDDNGMSWKKSETDTYEIKGNERMGYFGECKVIETSEGLRMYNSWSDYDYVAYSDSTDNGVTWGELKFYEDMPTPRASMQIVKDDHADVLTYYMVFVNNAQNRSRLTLMISNDGMNWSFVGDIWRWESGFKEDGSLISHIVDPFIKTTEDYIICGSGFSEKAGVTALGDSDWHNAQRQHIFAIRKDTLTAEEDLYRFTDVTTHQSYYEAVKFAVDNGLFNGTSETTFEPDTAMNRAMFVTVLGRLDKADVSKYTKPTFSDVIAGQWYTSYVEWAAANGIVNGMGGGVYGVTGTVTVEQALTILYRYNGGKSGSLDGKSMTDFSDASAVSSWAADGVKWAVENGIYDGIGGKLAPSSAASRATVATVFSNYVKAFG